MGVKVGVLKINIPFHSSQETATMSYPSVTNVLVERNLNLHSASEAQLRDALWEAFHRDLPEGTAYVTAFAGKIKAEGKQIIDHDAHKMTPAEIAQVSRLLGTDVARSICEEKLGVTFAYYNCHSPAGAPGGTPPKVTALQQIMLQNGEHASVDC